MKSAHKFYHLVDRIVVAVRENTIRYLGEIDQVRLAAAADIKRRPSKLLLFGNPPLGLQVLTANPLAGLDWPVRALVTQDPNGAMWVADTDSAFIAQLHAMADSTAALAMATTLSALVTHSTASP